MPAIEPGQRRVSVHAGTAVVDLTLPAAVPVAVLIPSIVDLLGAPDAADASAEDEPRGYRLSRPGLPALAASTTLADNDISDGSVLVLGRAEAQVAPVRHDDAAQAMATTLGAVIPPWGRRETRLTSAAAAICLTGVGTLALTRNAFTGNGAGGAGPAACVGLVAMIFAAVAHRSARDAVAGLALSLIATGFAAVAGFLAVPGAPGTPSALLAASAAAATAVCAMRTSGCGAVTMTAVACGTGLVAAAALAGMLTSAPACTVGAVSVLASLILLGVAGRVSITLAGLSPRLAADGDDDPDRLAAKALRADAWLVSLLAAFSFSAAVGAVVTVVAGAPRLSCLAFGALTGALLMLRSRCNDVRRALVFVITGLTITATTFGVAAIRYPQHGPWIAAGSAMLAAAAMCGGSAIPALSFSPVARRGRELIESSVAVAMVPLACWICGLYGAVRGLVLG